MWLPDGEIESSRLLYKEYYPALFFDCTDYDTLYELMTHDKKNEGGIINFTLLKNVGDVRINTNRSPRKKSWSLLIFIVKVLAFNGKKLPLHP